MKKAFRVAVTVFSIFLFFSCQDAGFFSGDSASAEIITPEDGIILRSNDEIPIELFFENENPSSFSITLVDSTDTVRGIVTLDEEELVSEIPPLGIPEELEDGYYRLNLELFTGEEILTSRILPFFLLENQPHIHGMTSYPLVFYPGGKGLVFLESYLPSGLEPWVRWSFEGEVIAQGPLSDGLDRVLVTVPETMGFYNLSVEMVPLSPPEGEDEWSFTSPLIAETLISVDENIQTGGNIFGQSGYFYSLFHFQGEYNDWGDREEPMELYFGNEPEIDLLQGIFGYRMDPFSSFRAESFLFPVNEDGYLEPFSLFLNFLIDENPENRQIVETGISGFGLSITTDIFGIPQVVIIGEDTELILTLENPLEPGVYNPVIISVYPDYETERLTLSWYHEGTFVSVSTGELVPQGLVSEGYTVLGGNYGGVDILDELGVYYLDLSDRPSPVTGLFNAWCIDTYGTDLVYAEGFDFLEPEEEFLLEAQLNTGEFSHSFGRLELGPESLINLPGLPLEDGSYNLLIGQTVLEDTINSGNVWLEFREETEEGAILVCEIPFPKGNLEIDVTISMDEGLLFVGEEFFALNDNISEEIDEPLPSSIPVYDEESEPRKIIAGISNRGENSVFIDNILIVSEPVHVEEDFAIEYPPEL